MTTEDHFPDTIREDQEFTGRTPVGYISRDTYHHMQKGYFEGGYISRKRDKFFCIPLYLRMDHDA